MKIRVIAMPIAFLLVGTFGGCSAHRRPPDLTASEQLLLRAMPLPYSVVTQPWTPATAARLGKVPAPYAETLSKTMAASGAFRSTHLAKGTGLASGDLVATSTGTYCNSAVIPLYTLLSLGIFPTVFEDEDCVGLVLRPAHASEVSGSVRIEYQYKGKVVLGWPALLIGLLPGWRHGSARDDPRFYQRLRLEVLKERTRLESLTAK